MADQIFREKSIQRISSPEELNQYLKVTNPGVWTVLVAVIVLLAGLIVWSSVGELQTKAAGIAEVSNGEVTVTVAGERASMVDDGQTVIIDGQETVINNVETDDYGRAVGFAVLNVPDGKYNCEVVVESIKPIRFLIK